MGTDWAIFLPLLGGLALGGLFGALAAKTRFCLLGAVSDLILFSRPDRLVFWTMTSLAGLALTSMLVASGWLDLSATSYLAGPLVPVASLVGGGCFGVGMILASGCVLKQLIRVGSGDLKSLIVVLFVALSARMTMTGRLEALRRWLGEAVTLPLSQPVLAPLVFAVAAGSVFLSLIVICRRFRWSVAWEAAAIIGLLIAGGWLLSTEFIAIESSGTLMGNLWDDLPPPESLSYVRPIVDLFDWLCTGLVDLASTRYGFPIGIVVGTIAGAAFWFGWMGHHRLTGFRDARDLLSHAVGGMLMGFGGVVAGGCSVGAGLSGVSTGSLNAAIALLSMTASAAAALVFQARRLS